MNFDCQQEFPGIPTVGTLIFGSNFDPPWQEIEIADIWQVHPLSQKSLAIAGY